MKKSLFYFASVLAIVCGCSKELEQNQKQEDVTPIQDVKTYIIRASINHETKTTVTDLGIYSWVDDEMIGVADGTTTKKNFTIDNTQKDAGVFKYTGDDVSGDLRYAVSPYNVMTVPATTGNDVTINLRTSYTSENGGTNAIMIAGAPDIEGEEHVFEFHHAMAVMKFTYANAPVGTKSFRLTMDQNISGASITVDATTAPEIRIEDLTGGELSKSTTINLPTAITEKNTTVSFYVPVPTGTYKTFKAELLNVGGVTLKTNNKALGGAGLTLGKADLFIAPTISIPAAPATDTFTLVEDKYDMVNGQYVILAKKTGEATKYSYLVSTTTGTESHPTATVQDIFNGSATSVSSSSVTDEMLLTFTAVSGGWKIQNSEGSTLYAPNSGNHAYIGSTSDTWSIIDHPTASFSLKSNSYNRYLGVYVDGGDFRTYTDVNHTNFASGVTSQIKLYYRGALVPKPQLVAPTEVIADNNTDDDSVTNIIDVVWADDANEASDVDHYIVRLTPTSGDPVEHITTAYETASKSVSVGDLDYSMEYTVDVKAISADYTTHKDSDWSTPDAYAVATTGAMPEGAEVPTTHTVLFGSSYNSKGVSGYNDVSFTVKDSQNITWNINNWNNNNNGWSFIKAGGKNGAYTGTITNASTLPITVCKVTITIDAITSSNVTTLQLKVATNSSFTSGLQTYDIPKSSGTKTITIDSPIKDAYYKVEAVCTKGSSNGLITVSRLTFTNIP